MWFCLYVRHTFKCQNVTYHQNVTDIQTRWILKNIVGPSLTQSSILSGLNFLSQYLTKVGCRANPALSVITAHNVTWWLIRERKCDGRTDRTTHIREYEHIGYYSRVLPEVVVKIRNDLSHKLRM